MEISTALTQAAVTTTGELPEQQQDQCHEQQHEQQHKQQEEPQTYGAHLIGQILAGCGSEQLSFATQPAMAVESQTEQHDMAHCNAAPGHLSSSPLAAAAATATGLPQVGSPEFEPSFIAADSKSQPPGVSTGCLDATQLSALGLVPAGSYVGLVKSFNPIKGFGFINSQAIGGDLFFHRKELPAEIQSGDISSLQGRTVAFELRSGEGGRARAGRVQLLPTDGQPTMGTVKSYSERNGYGFITTPSLSRDVHFKRGDMPPELHSCTGVELAGKNVVFRVEVLKDGKLKAMNLQLAGSVEQQTQLRLPVPAAVPAIGGAGGGCGAQEKAKLQGFVSVYDANSGTGILQAPGVADALRFDGFGLELVPGQLVRFTLHMFPDGSAEARGVAPAAPLPQNDMPFNGLVTTGDVKPCHELPGFGAVSVPKQAEELSFQGERMAADGKRSAVAAWDTTELLAGAPPLKQQRWEDVLPGMTAAESLPGMTTGPPQLLSGTSEQATARMAGAVKSFNMAKGFGFIACQGVAEDIFFLRSELPGGLTTGHAEQGQLVGFDLQLSPDGRYRAARISFE